jgi:hypothetical protein
MFFGIVYGAVGQSEALGKQIGELVAGMILLEGALCGSQWPVTLESYKFGHAPECSRC